jgi:hypothetical protein
MGWEEIALKIAAGVLENLAIGALENLFGHGGPDIRVILTDALRAFESILKQVIADAFIKEHGGELAGLQLSYNDYIGMRQDMNFLNIMRANANTLTGKIEIYDIKTVPAYSIVGGLNLAIHQEYYSHTQQRGDRKTICDAAQHLVAQRAILQQKLHEFNASRFSEIRPVASMYDKIAWQYTDLRGIGQPNTPHGIWENTDRAAVERYRDGQIADEYNIIENQILSPAYPVFDKWAEISQKFS